jgi:U3 small nucleolar RNA-associated protein 4
MSLVIRDPDNFHNKAYSVPKLEDLRLFTAGSDSTDLVERCLSTGSILVCHHSPHTTRMELNISVNLPNPLSTIMVNLCLANSSISRISNFLPFAPFPNYSIPLWPSRTTTNSSTPIRYSTLAYKDSITRMGNPKSDKR